MSGTQAFGDTEEIDDPNLIFAEAGLTFRSALDFDSENPSNATVIAEPLILYDTWAAIFVRMDVTPVTCPCRSLRPLTDEDPVEAQVGASAIADFMQYACDIDPLFLCLPGPGVSDGQMVRLVTGGSGAAWEPGNSGFPEVLEDFVNPNGPCEDLKETQHIRCGMGATDLITQCYSIRGVDTEMGEKVGITQDPFNFRFDLFPNSMKSQQNEPDFAPAPNIITGMVPSVKEEGPPLQPGQRPDLRHGRPE